MNKIAPLKTLNIDYYKQKMLHDIHINKRFKNTPKIEELIIDKPIKYDGYTYYGGVFNMPPGSLFLLEILVEHLPNIDDPNTSISFLESKKGRDIQIKEFRKKYLKPLKKFLKNRDIANKDFALALLKEMINNENNIYELSKYLDEHKSYTPLDILKYKAIKKELY
jgi:hypothetical protein